MAGKFLADQITYQGEIPQDLKGEGIRGRTVSFYEPYEAIEKETGNPLDNNQLLRRILMNSDIDIMLRTIGNAFFPRVITIGTRPTETAAISRSLAELLTDKDAYERMAFAHNPYGDGKACQRILGALASRGSV